MSRFIAFLVALCMACSASLANAKEAKKPAVPKSALLEVTEFDDAHTEAVVKQLREWDDAGVKEVWIRIDTHGGSVDNGFKMIKQIEHMRAHTVCLVDTKAYSMGFALLQACQERLVTTRSSLMVHEVIFQRVGGGPQDLLEAAKLLQMFSEQMMNHNLRRLNITKEVYIEKTKGKTWFMPHDEALKIGAIDKVIDPLDKRIPRETPLKIEKQGFFLFGL